ncbi:hypothetical protein [Streptomyces agglomeratus]|nr:hypothetical protein [Streptomyces agglomeratus]
MSLLTAAAPEFLGSIAATLAVAAVTAAVRKLHKALATTTPDDDPD